nr:unnamed protein product [Callosobruchus analis]
MSIEGFIAMPMITTSSFTLETFNIAETKWSRWVKRLEVAFCVFNVPDDLKLVTYLLHFMGPEAYDTLCDKLAPNSPEDRAYNEVVQMMDQCYNPCLLEIAEICRFQSRKQQEGESVQEYYYALQKLSIICKFGEYLKMALRNQFVYGLHSRRIQGRLLESRDLTLDRAVEISTSMEMSERDANQTREKPILLTL